MYTKYTGLYTSSQVIVRVLRGANDDDNSTAPPRTRCDECDRPIKPFPFDFFVHKPITIGKEIGNCLIGQARYACGKSSVLCSSTKNTL